MNILTREVHKKISEVRSETPMQDGFNGPLTGEIYRSAFRQFHDKTRMWLVVDGTNKLVDCVRIKKTYIWGPTDRERLQAKLDELGLQESEDYLWGNGYGGLNLIYYVESRK